jgi:hypothetical protein
VLERPPNLCFSAIKKKSDPPRGPHVFIRHGRLLGGGGKRRKFLNRKPDCDPVFVHDFRDPVFPGRGLYLSKEGLYDFSGLRAGFRVPYG